MALRSAAASPQRVAEPRSTKSAGSGSLSASICDDPVAMAEQLAELYHSGITAAPKHVLSAGQLARAIESEDDAGKLLEELRSLVGERHTIARCLPSLAAER